MRKYHRIRKLSILQCHQRGQYLGNTCRIELRVYILLIQHCPCLNIHDNRSLSVCSRSLRPSLGLIRLHRHRINRVKLLLKLLFFRQLFWIVFSILSGLPRFTGLPGLTGRSLGSANRYTKGCIQYNYQDCCQQSLTLSHFSHPPDTACTFL